MQHTLCSPTESITRIGGGRLVVFGAGFLSSNGSNEKGFWTQAFLNVETAILYIELLHLLRDAVLEPIPVLHSICLQDGG